VTAIYMGHNDGIQAKSILVFFLEYSRCSYLSLSLSISSPPPSYPES
jgi:hypothetical protein